MKMEKINLKLNKEDTNRYISRAEQELKPKFSLPRKKYIKPNTEW